jgi:hypothetical protein
MLIVFMSWLPLVAKLLLTAAIVVAASATTERAGPFIGALVVTLPVTFWPAYLFIALDHDTAYVAASVVAGLMMHAVTAVLMLVYVLMAQRFSVLPSLAVAVGVWVLVGVTARSFEWSFPSAVVLNVVTYALALWGVRNYRHAPMPATQRRWYDVPVRVTLVVVLMGLILLASGLAGPVVTGFLAVFPISSCSAALILHPRIGGKATAAMVANGVRGMVGLAISFAALYLTVVPFGSAAALTLMLAIAVGWNLTTYLTRTRAKLAVPGIAPANARPAIRYSPSGRPIG